MHRIPPYFALIIRAIGVLEGIALVGDPEFALVDEAYPYIAKRLLTDESPRLQAALRYMVYGEQGIFDADRLIDLLNAFESFAVASQSSRGDMDQEVAAAAAAARNGSSSSSRNSPFGGGIGFFGPQLIPQLPQLPLPLPVPGAAFGDGTVAVAGAPGIGLFGLPANRFDLRQQSTLDSQGRLREALRFIFSPEGSFFRTFLLDEVVKSIDALSREQLVLLVQRLGLAGVRVPVLLPGARHASVPLSPHISEEDRQVVDNVVKIVNFLTKGSLSGAGPADASLLLELLPVLPTVAREVLPQVTSQLSSRILARAVRALYT